MTIFLLKRHRRKVNELSIAVINAVKSDLAKLEEIALTAQDILADIDDEDIKENF